MIPAVPALGASFGVLTRGMATAASAVAQQGAGSKIGFIGLGKMGAAMLGRLVQHGHQAVVFDSNKVALERAVTDLQGVTEASSPADVAATQGVDILFTMLPHPGTVHQVYLGKDGILEAKGGPMASLMVDCSTVDPPTARKIAEVADRVRLSSERQPLPGLEEEDSPMLVDAPVSGGALGAHKGTLSFMVGCDEQALAIVKPYLLKMGHFVTYCGGHGNGQTAKLCNTLAMAASMAATSESLALARRLGVDPKVMTEVLNHGAGGSWCSQHYNPVPGINPDAPPSHGFKAGMSVDGIIQQLDMLVTAGEHSHSPVPLARYLNSELYKKVHAEGLGDKDFSSIFRYYYGSGHTSEQWQAGDRLFNSHAP